MHPDWLARLIHCFEKGLKSRIVERPSCNIGIDLHAKRAVIERAFSLAHASIGRDQRCLANPARKLIRIFLANFGEAVVHELRVFLSELAIALGHNLQWRHGIGEDLSIVLESVNDLATGIKIMNAWD